MVVIGMLLIVFGVVVFAVALLKIMTIPYYLFIASEKTLDQKLFKTWKKEQDYKDFEKKVDNITAP